MNETPPTAVQWHKLRAFAAVAEHGSVHRAARAIHLSQPAVTRAVQQTELALGAALFDRTTKGMVLTAAGRYVKFRVERALNELRFAVSAIAARVPGACGVQQRHRGLVEVVNERMLASLVAVWRGGNESVAADFAGLSVPALQRNLRQLEQLACISLVTRSGGAARLTDAGEILLRHAQLALAEIRVAREELESMQGRLAGRLVVGALPLSSGHLVPGAVDRTLRAHPDLHISIIDGTYETLSHGLRCAEVNVIVGALRAVENEPYVAHETLFTDSLNVVARAGHPVFRRGALRGLRDLTGETWLMPLAGTPSHAAFERAFRADGVEPPAARLQGNSPAIVRSLLLSSDRLALLSVRQVQHELQQHILKVVPVDVRHTERRIGLATLRDSVPSPGMTVLLCALRDLAGATPGKADYYCSAALQNASLFS